MLQKNDRRQKKIKGLLMHTPLDLTNIENLLTHNFSYINDLLEKWLNN